MVGLGHAAGLAFTFVHTLLTLSFGCLSRCRHEERAMSRPSGTTGCRSPSPPRSALRNDWRNAAARKERLPPHESRSSLGGGRGKERCGATPNHPNSRHHQRLLHIRAPLHREYPRVRSASPTPRAERPRPRKREAEAGEHRQVGVERHALTDPDAKRSRPSSFFKRPNYRSTAARPLVKVPQPPRVAGDKRLTTVGLVHREDGPAHSLVGRHFVALRLKSHPASVQSP